MKQLTRAELRQRKAERHERAQACLDLAEAIIESGVRRHVSIELSLDHSNVQIPLRGGNEFTGEELHDFQEFLYEHGAKMRLYVDHREGAYILIWPHKEEEHDEDD
jgi:hypothetical protein